MGPGGVDTKDVDPAPPLRSNRIHTGSPTPLIPPMGSGPPPRKAKRATGRQRGSSPRRALEQDEAVPGSQQPRSRRAGHHTGKKVSAMGTQTGSKVAAVYDVTYPDGHHVIETERAGVYADLVAGAAYAVELERANWHEAIAAEHRDEVAVLDAKFEAGDGLAGRFDVDAAFDIALNMGGA